MKHWKRLIEIGMLILGIILLVGCGLIAAKDPLEETIWSLTDLAGSSLLEGTTITIQFFNGQVGGSSGCNSYGGTYEVSGDKLETAELVSTMMACEDSDMMDQEQIFLSYLQAAESFKLEESQLKIITTEGAELLFVPVE